MMKRDLGPSQYKDGLSRYGDFHYKDKTFNNGNSYTGETYLCWDGFLAKINGQLLFKAP